jgi:hypothetical protein
MTDPATFFVDEEKTGASRGFPSQPSYQTMIPADHRGRAVRFPFDNTSQRKDENGQPFSKFLILLPSGLLRSPAFCQRMWVFEDKDLICPFSFSAVSMKAASF